MTTIDFSPLYRSTVGFDSLANMLDNAMQTNSASGYPPYDIESVDEGKYKITLAVAGFSEDELDIQTENGVLTISGKRDDEKQGNYLHRGIAKRSFERKFQLADHVEVDNAELVNGLLQVSLLKEVPEALKPKKISIGAGTDVLPHQKATAAKVESAAAA